MQLETVINVLDGFLEALAREYQLPLAEVIMIARALEIRVWDDDDREELADIIETVVNEYSIIYGCDSDKFIGQDRVK